MLPVAKKQPLPTTSVSGSVTCREQENFQITTRFHVFLIFVALGLFEKRTQGTRRNRVHWESLTSTVSWLTTADGHVM